MNGIEEMCQLNFKARFVLFGFFSTRLFAALVATCVK